MDLQYFQCGVRPLNWRCCRDSQLFLRVQVTEDLSWTSNTTAPYNIITVLSWRLLHLSSCSLEAPATQCGMKTVSDSTTLGWTANTAEKIICTSLSFIQHTYETLCNALNIVKDPANLHYLVSNALTGGTKKRPFLAGFRKASPLKLKGFLTAWEPDSKAEIPPLCDVYLETVSISKRSPS